MIEIFGLDISALALDMTNFATYIDTTNDRAPIASAGQGQAETRRPAPGRARAGRHPRRRDPAGLPRLPRQPARRHPVPHHDRPAGEPLHRAGHAPPTPPPTRRRRSRRGRRTGGRTAAEMTVVFDAGQNSAANFAHLARHRAALRRVGPARRTAPTCSPCPPPTATPWTSDRFPGAHRARHPPRGLRRRPPGRAHPLADPARPPSPAASTRPWPRPTAKLAELADTLARGHTRRTRDKVTAEITTIIKDPWVRRVIDWQLTGDTPAEHRLTLTSTTKPAPSWKPRCSANAC